jgi:(2R)-3-sulfolactate dehydrogenase (NADP+)
MGAARPLKSFLFPENGIEWFNSAKGCTSLSETRINLAELHRMVVKALCVHGTEASNAEQVAHALVAAEADGLPGHGLSRLTSYCAQVASGKIDGHAVPDLSQVANAVIVVDANYGFAYPAVDLAIEKLVALTQKTGVALAAITHSHHCGAAGYHVEALARQGLVALMFANTPKAIAPWGGTQAVFGTNPIAFAAPRRKNKPLVIDLSLSKVARGKILVASQQGNPIPEGWALDDRGKPTTNPDAALSGTMLPIGDAKGTVLAFMVEVLAAALTSSRFGFESSSFFSAEGSPPEVGQLLIAIAPGPISNGKFETRLEVLIEEILRQGDTRLPGDRRQGLREKAYRNGIRLTDKQYKKIVSLCTLETVDQ